MFVVKAVRQQKHSQKQADRSAHIPACLIDGKSPDGKRAFSAQDPHYYSRTAALYPKVKIRALLRVTEMFAAAQESIRVIGALHRAEMPHGALAGIFQSYTVDACGQFYGSAVYIFVFSDKIR